MAARFRIINDHDREPDPSFIVTVHFEDGQVDTWHGLDESQANRMCDTYAEMPNVLFATVRREI